MAKPDVATNAEGLMANRLFISAGEASGDSYAAELIHAVGTTDLVLEGVGGPRMAKAGATLVADSSHWGAIGILQSLLVTPKVLRGYNAAKRALSQGDKGLLVAIDFGYMNVKLARFAKALGWKVLYFIPPGSWRKTKQGSDLPAITDAIVTPFPWSAEILCQMGANAHFFGHPLKEMVARTPDALDRESIAVLPGSRMHEISSNLPAIAATLHGQEREIEFAVASNVDPTELAQAWAALSSARAKFTTGDTYGVLKRARAAIVCSGTATLEAALCMCPTVVMYKGTSMMRVEYRIRKPKFTYISLPNILLDSPLLPELIDRDASAEAIRAHLTELLVDGPARQVQLDAFESLGSVDCLEKTASLIGEMLAH